MAIRMEHANLTVQHFDEAVRFLQTAFPEFKIRRDGERDGRRWMHIGTDESYVALNEAVAEALDDWAPYCGRPGINHLGFEVEDAEGIRKRLTKAGFRDATYPNNHPHRNRVYFYDADGNDWEFVEYFSDDPALRNDYELPD